MENLEDKICIFLAYVYKMRRDFAYPLCNIYNVDDIRGDFRDFEKASINGLDGEAKLLEILL